MITATVDKQSQREFDKALKKYIDVNKRDNAWLVQDQLHKTLTGVSKWQEQPGGKKVRTIQRPGLRLMFYDDKVTKTSIEQEAKHTQFLYTRARKLIWAGRYRKKGSKRLITSVRRENILKRRSKNPAFLSSTFLFNKWGRAKKDGSRTLYPVKNRATKAVIIQQWGGELPRAQWTSYVPGVIVHGIKKGYFSAAMRHAAADMVKYVQDKAPSNFKEAFR